nr:M23 family metallopeptidase [Chamaesiphon sp. VAR_48_metabat_135_sub]
MSVSRELSQTNSSVLITVVLKFRRLFLLKPETTQKVKLVHSPNPQSEMLTSQSSVTITDRQSSLAKITRSIGNGQNRTSVLMLGLTVLMGMSSFPANYLNPVTAAESAINSTGSTSRSIVESSAHQSTSKDRYIEQLRSDVSDMQAQHERKPSGPIAQAVTPRSYPQSVANRTDSNNLQFTGEVVVPIEVAAPKTKTFKPVATAQPYATGSEGYIDNSNDNFPTQTGETTIGFSWPAAGKLTSKFGRRWGRMHKGIDIAGPIGTPINAAADGTVIAAGWNSGGYGNLVEVRHNDGTITRYGHNSRLSVSVGQTVRQGQQVAEMGSTGHSTGSHLHFEIRPTGGNAVNPIAHLPANS